MTDTQGGGASVAGGASHVAMAVAQRAGRAPREPLRRLARLVLADALDRMRRPGFLVSLLVMLWVGQHMLPPADAPYRTWSMDEVYRPAYNSAWVGTLTAMLTGLWFALIGFYQVRGSVERDRRSGVGQVLAATRLGSGAYLWTRVLGNITVFAAQAAAVLLAGLITQQALGEERRVELLPTLIPYLTFTVPLALFTSAAAVLFDCFRPFRGGFGNIAWFFLFGLFMAGTRLDDPQASAWRDFSGARIVVQDVRRELIAQHPEAASRPGTFSMGVNVNPRFRDHPAQTFEWRGLRWTPVTAASRLPWLALSAVLVFAAGLAFDRFATPAAAAEARAWRWPRLTAGREPRPVLRSSAELTVPGRGWAAPGILRAELALLLRAPSPWWYVVLAGLWVAQLAAPLAGVRQVVLPLAAIWPALVWSSLGQRERRYATGDVMFSCPRPAARLLPAAWLAGAAVMVLAGAPALVRLASAGEWEAVAGWGLAGAFVSALALAAGAWTGGGTLFEVTYLFLWYAGPMQRIAWLDYTGVTTPRPAGAWRLYAGLALGAFWLAWLRRGQRSRR